MEPAPLGAKAFFSAISIVSSPMVLIIDWLTHSKFVAAIAMTMLTFL